MKGKMKRFVAFAMTLCLCITQMFAYSYIEMEVVADKLANGQYEVAYTAEVSMDYEDAKKAAWFGEDYLKRYFTFVCTLHDDFLAERVSTPASDMFVFGGDGAVNFECVGTGKDIFGYITITFKIKDGAPAFSAGYGSEDTEEIAIALMEPMTITATERVTDITGFTTHSVDADIELVSLDPYYEDKILATGTASPWIRYTVTFDANGGTVGTATAKTNEGYKLSGLPTPTCSGYNFIGWYTTPVEGGEQVRTNTVFRDNCTVYARWSPKAQYTVTFNANGGSVTPASATTDLDGKLSSLPTPTRNGYTFAGWYTAATGGTLVPENHVFSENTTIYARWTGVTPPPGPGPGGEGGGNEGGGGAGGTGSVEDDEALSGNEGHEVQIDNANPKGNATTEKPKAIPTDRVVIDVEDIQKGYRVVRVIVRDAEGNEIEVDRESATSYSFVMPNGAVTVETVYDLSSTPPHKSGVSEHLITNEHVVFMTGYPNNTFMPNANVTRAEVATIFYALLRNKNVDITTKFNDVNANAWYSTFVNTLASLGVVSGVGNNKFDPERPITRAEFAVIASKFAKSTEHYYDFDDVPDSFWGNSFVNTAAAYGWVAGVGGNNYEPNRPITRAEVATIVNNMLGRVGDYDRIDDGHGRQFNDVSSTFWGRYEIAEASTDHDHTIDDEYIDETWHK